MVFITFLAILNMITDGSDNLWFLYPAAGWGVAVAIHGFRTFVVDGMFGDDWEERKVQELMGEKAKRSLREDYFE